MHAGWVVAKFGNILFTSLVVSPTLSASLAKTPTNKVLTQLGTRPLNIMSQSFPDK